MLARSSGWKHAGPTGQDSALTVTDGFGESDHADAIAIQIQFRKSLGRKPPIQDACLPFRP